MTEDQGITRAEARGRQVYKFEKLDVYQGALGYLDTLYALATRLPHSEEHNLRSQIVRAGTSIALNIAEGSTGQSDSEQARFLGMALRSLIETVACLHIVERRRYCQPDELTAPHDQARKLFAQIIAMQHTLRGATQGRSPVGRPSSPVALP